MQYIKKFDRYISVIFVENMMKHFKFYHYQDGSDFRYNRKITE
jgi:hypothetical protein